MRARLIRLSPLAAVILIPVVLKQVRDRAVERNRAATPWLQEDHVRFDTTSLGSSNHH